MEVWKFLYFVRILARRLSGSGTHGPRNHPVNLLWLRLLHEHALNYTCNTMCQTKINLSRLEIRHESFQPTIKIWRHIWFLWQWFPSLHSRCRMSQLICLFALLAQFSAIEIRWVISHAKLMISWLLSTSQRQISRALSYSWAIAIHSSLSELNVSRQILHVFNYFACTSACLWTSVNYFAVRFRQWNSRRWCY